MRFSPSTSLRRGPAEPGDIDELDELDELNELDGVNGVDGVDALDGRDEREPPGHSRTLGTGSGPRRQSGRGPGRRAGPARRHRWGPVARRGRWRQSVALRVLAAVLLGVAAWTAVTALTPTPADPGSPVLVLARSLPVGATLTEADLRVERRPAVLLPEGAIAAPADAAGRVLAGPVGSGEILTSTRFQGPEQLSGLRAGSLAVGVPLADPGLSSTLRPGDTVTVLAGGTGQVVVAAAPVLAVRPEDRGGLTGTGTSGRVLLAVSPDEARGIAAAGGPSAAAAPLLVALRR